MLSYYFRTLLIVLALILISIPTSAATILWKETQIPMSEAGSQGLESLLVWPNLPGKHPLALISHGSPRDAKQRNEMSAISYLPIAMEFARRGFSVAVVLRRGYGRSGGGWAESFGSCNSTHYQQSALQSSRDLHAAINYLATLPQFDTERMIAVGVSAGGLATVALTADSPPKGLIAAISFAGGRGSSSSNHICQEEDLDSAFAFLGKTSRIPMLWVYAKNDQFFNPAAAQKFYKAFTENGGNAKFLSVPAFGTEGHYLFSAKGIPIWTPIVDDFLKSQNLVLLKEKLALPASTFLNPPKQLAPADKNAFISYLASPPHKAFAVDARGAYGWRSGRHSIDEAKKDALEACELYSRIGCKIYAVDETYLAQ